MSLRKELPVIFTAQSKRFFYCRDTICEFVLRKNCIPLNPFRVFEYFLSERVPRDLVRQGNNNLIRIADELWVFGNIADGVLQEIYYANELGKKIRYFSMHHMADKIKEIREVEKLKFEPGVFVRGQKKKDILSRIKGTFTDLDSPPTLFDLGD